MPLDRLDLETLMASPLAPVARRRRPAPSSSSPAKRLAQLRAAAAAAGPASVEALDDALHGVE